MRFPAGSFALLLLIAATTFARDPVVLEHANTLNSTIEDGQRKQELIGEVRIRKDSLRVYCQRAIYFQDRGDLIFRGAVEFEQPRRIMFADEVVYNEHSEEVNALGRVRIFQDSLQINCRRAVYRERFATGELYEDVVVKDEGRNLTLRGDRGYLDHNADYARVTGNPVLTRRDSSNALTVRIHADTLEYFGEEQNARAGGSVIVERENLMAFGTRLTYHQDSSYAELLGDPHAVHALDEISGDTLRMFLVDEQLDRLEVVGNAVATSPADSLHPEPRNRMEGKRMQLWIHDDAISRVEVTRNATATYYIRDDNKPEGRNVTSGDELIVFFEDSEISHIEVHGGTQGTYTPEHLLPREPSR